MTKRAGNGLTSEEEKVVRMSQGKGAPDDLELEFMGAGHPDTLARLREIERMAFQATGRIDELRREAGVEVEASADNPAKDKIIAGLKDRTEEATAEAEVSAGAKSSKKS